MTRPRRSQRPTARPESIPAPAGDKYDLSKQQGGSLGFLYPGVHGLAAEQQWAGLFAPVLIEDGNEALTGYETHTMVIKDLAVSGNVAQSHLFMSDFMYGKEGSIVTINGQINPVLSAKRGQVQRWHMVKCEQRPLLPALSREPRAVPHRHRRRAAG